MTHSVIFLKLKETTMTISLEQHIEELRAELRNCCDRKKYREIKAALDEALAEYEAWLDEVVRDLEPPS